MGRILPTSPGFSPRERKVIDFARTSSVPLKDAAAALDLADAALQNKALFALLQGAGRGLQAGAQGVAGLFQGGPQAPQFPSLAAPVAGEPNFLQKFQEQVQALSPEEGQLLALADNLLKAGIPPEEVAGELAKTVPPETAQGLVDMLLAVEAGVAAPPPPGREQLLDEAALLTQNFLFKGGTDEDALDALAQQGAAPEEAEAVVSRARGELAAQEERERVESLLPEFTDPDQEDIARKLLAGTRPSDVVRELLKVPGADKAVAIAQVREVQESLAVRSRVQVLKTAEVPDFAEVARFAGEAESADDRGLALELAARSAQPENFLDLLTDDHRRRAVMKVNKILRVPRLAKTPEELASEIEGRSALATLRRQRTEEAKVTLPQRIEERAAKIDKQVADTELAAARQERLSKLTPVDVDRARKSIELMDARIKNILAEAAGIRPIDALQLVKESLRDAADVARRSIDRLKKRLLDIEGIEAESTVKYVSGIKAPDLAKLQAQQQIRKSSASTQKEGVDTQLREELDRLTVILEARERIAAVTSVEAIPGILAELKKSLGTSFLGLKLPAMQQNKPPPPPATRSEEEQREEEAVEPVFEGELPPAPRRPAAPPPSGSAADRLKKLLGR